MNEIVIVCEGYDDRAFWKERLHLWGWTVDGDDRRTGRRLVGGVYGFAKGNRFARVIPSMSDDGALLQTAIAIRERNTAPFGLLVVNLDEDTIDTATPSTSRIQAISTRVEQEMGRRIEVDPMDGAFHLTNDPARDVVVPLFWRCNDEPHAELPPKQTLERLVVASLREVHPERAREVATWLGSRTNPVDEKPHKAMAYSHMAGWYADHGCDDFYRHVWREPPIAAALEARLTQQPAWAVVRRLLG
jgi:hypothetical protein